MGLTVRVKGLSCEDTYDCGYITFAVFRILLAKTYNDEFGVLYEKWAKGLEISQEDCNRMNELRNEDLDIFLQCSDCDGKMTPKECKRVYDIIKDYKMDMIGHNYGIMKQYNMLEQWKGIFRHCYKRRVNLYFT